MSAFAGCSGKIRYSTRHEAMTARQHIRQRTRDGQKVNCYHCQNCDGYHLGRAKTGEASHRSYHRRPRRTDELGYE
jgi:hypothetical protein